MSVNLSGPHMLLCKRHTTDSLSWTGALTLSAPGLAYLEFPEPSLAWVRPSWRHFTHADSAEQENGNGLPVWDQRSTNAPRRVPPSSPRSLRLCPAPAHLVIDQQLHGVMARLQQHNLIGLPRHRVGEGGALASAARPGAQPHADGEGVELGQCLPHAGVHVVVADGNADLEGIWGTVG